MGEAAVSSEAGMELLVFQETEKQKITADGGAAAAEMVGWEKFLPKMVVRVLLVEADDSTRQIIAALLRKCSYKVAAVPDGLKAWEVLKGRPHNIDLILTEVDLPSISGYALLTLIMEHDVCKNIPVIMMSSHDSVSTVYKCMLRGAADFLVKPVRKNELRNLWQHVWRKQASNTAAGLGPPDHSSGYTACGQRNSECIEKGSDTQSSCSKSESGTEGLDIEHVLSLLEPNMVKCLPDDNKISTEEESHQESGKKRARDNDSGESRGATDADANYATTQGQDKNLDDDWEKVNVTGQNHGIKNSSREAIDLIGAFDNHHKGNFRVSAPNVNANKLDMSTQLDLSLRRSHPDASVDKLNDERHMLNHSDASAFSRYIHKPLHPRISTSPETSNQQKDHETNSASTIRQPEIAFSYTQEREISVPVAVRGVRFDNVINAYDSVMPPVCCAQSSLSPLRSPRTSHHTESFPPPNPFNQSDDQPSSRERFHDVMDQSVVRTDENVERKSENVKDQGHDSPANDRNGDSTFCNGNISHHLSMVSRSNGKTNEISIVKVMSECGNEEGFHVREGASHRSLQREAALMKFRLKRKERCFDKKVRYESRKKLAEQRPRVKGQFVRQAPTDSQTGNSSAS